MQVDGVKESCCRCWKSVDVDAGTGEDEGEEELKKKKGHEKW